MISTRTQTVVVIGNGMVGHRFCEKLVELDGTRRYRIVTFCEEPRAAYDRVGLTSFFAHRNAERLMLANAQWYQQSGIELHVGDRASRIERGRRVVHSEKGHRIEYDNVVLATGSYPFVPPVDGMRHRGVFVYRTIDDLEQIIAYGQNIKRAAVVGGGLLGLEAAKAAYDLGLETHVIEFTSRLMPRQIDDAGSRLLVRKIEELGVTVHLNKATREVQGSGRVERMVFADDDVLDVDMIIVSAGIRPRDELARECGIAVGERGGVVVNDVLETSDPAVYAIGEAALHDGKTYGLVAPGYEMAEIVAANLGLDEPRTFTGADLSTKLKLLGVDVASFGDYEAGPETAQPLIHEDPFGGVYKKLLFDHAGTRLLGGVLVGEASQYAGLLALTKSGAPLPCQPGELVLGSRDAAVFRGADAISDDVQACSCNNVTKGQILASIRNGDLTTLDGVRSCTAAGTGCGGCLPLVTDILNAELAAVGKTVDTSLCEHFAFTRQELYDIVKIRQIKTFRELIEHHGRGSGCEICKPAVTSILAGLWNENILAPDHQSLQDTNDRFLANIQRGGLYSIVPRVPGGEITPDKLITLGRVAKKYGLYTKITGGQRVDLFGAQPHQLPEIWEELVAAGFESGHAYGKALRTVKSCVGSTWCRYGVQNSVAFAIQLEQRYRGIRAPHKVKMAVSGCVRECAEAQSKDIGLVATDNGYNLYVCGNGGAKPRHAELLVANIDEETAIRYIDRFMMYYIRTADTLTRTAVWVEKMAGGLEHLRDVVIHDKLGINAELERQMQTLVDGYRCEWLDVVNDPTKRRLFRQFVNTEDTEPGIEIIAERGQNRPADWPRDGVPLSEVKLAVERRGDAGRQHGRRAGHDAPADGRNAWVDVGAVADFPHDCGSAIKYGNAQIAVFNFASRGEWYACQNMCPHKNAFLLSRGIIGSVGTTPKVACPLHKKPFSLHTGQCLSGEDFSVKVFPVKVQGDRVFLDLPPSRQLDALLATDLHCVGAGDAERATPVACAVCG